MKGELTKFYETRGFRLYGRSYSEHFETINSIPNILNFGETSAGSFKRGGGYLKDSRYFHALKQQGFNIRVFQSSYLDYCDEDDVIECTSYWFASLMPVYRSNLPRDDKASIIFFNFVIESNFIAYLSVKYDKFVRRDLRRYPNLTINLRRNGRTSSITALNAFDTVIARLTKAKAGDAYFVHLLLPHFPYVVDRQCNLLPRADWRYRRVYDNDVLTHLGHENQISCVNKKLAEALAAAGRSRQGENDLVVIVHGDHGSRIVSRDPIAPLPRDYQPGDLVRAYSTLFAIKAPGITAGYEEQAAPVSWLLAETARSRFSSAPDPRRAPKGQRVFVADTDWKVRGTTTLPAYW